MKLQEIQNQINSFDYYYEYSDNHSVWTRCSRAAKSINSELNTLTPSELFQIVEGLKYSEQALKHFPVLKTAQEPKKETFRAKVFKRAYQIKTSTGKAFAVCLSKAWALYRLSKKMLTGQVSFTFEKKDGSLRKANGTLRGVSPHIKGTNQSPASTFPYWDLQAGGFRSFKVENLVSVF